MDNKVWRAGKYGISKVVRIVRVQIDNYLNDKRQDISHVKRRACYERSRFNALASAIAINP